MSGARFRVRRATVADLGGVVEMERGVAEAPHWGEAEYAAMLKEESSVAVPVRRCLMVAEAEGRLLGFAVGKVMGFGLGEIESVAVDVAVRRRGVGRVLCEAVVGWCREQEAVAVELEVRAGSAGPIALYRGLGFLVVGRRKSYYREPVDDALLMKLELAGGERAE